MFPECQPRLRPVQGLGMEGWMSHTDPTLLRRVPRVGQGGGRYSNPSCDGAGRERRTVCALYPAPDRVWMFSEETALASGWKDCYRCQSIGGATAVAGRGELCLRERPRHVLRPRSKPGTRCQCSETLQHPMRKLLSQMRKLRFEEVRSPSLVHPEHAGFSRKTPPPKGKCGKCSKIFRKSQG